uniref:NADH dehydrogenase subunit 6 n=1 Tax=Idiostolus sp. TaxID=2931296 RepID=A0A8T9ZYB4_9HEMI|nr:NADH dehydrogenase subunit 6 [Idiostolus sp.]
MTILMSLMTIFSYILLWLNHPLSMGLILILQSLIMALLIGVIMENFWFSYILLIIMMSGMLVLFIYMASVASNEKFYFSMKLLYTSFFLLIMLIINIYYNEYLELENSNININNKMEIVMLNKLFNGMTMLLTMMMVLYLFFTMIVVTNIVNMTEGPLRMKT